MAAARLTPIPCVELQSDTTMLAPQPLLYGCGVGTLGPLQSHRHSFNLRSKMNLAISLVVVRTCKFIQAFMLCRVLAHVLAKR